MLFPQCDFNPNSLIKRRSLGVPAVLNGIGGISAAPGCRFYPGLAQWVHHDHS